MASRRPAFDVSAVRVFFVSRGGMAIAFALFSTVAQLRRVTELGFDPLSLILVHPDGWERFQKTMDKIVPPKRRMPKRGEVSGVRIFSQALSDLEISECYAESAGP